MPAISFRCPHCQAILKMETQPAAGKKVKCPKCSNVFLPAAAKESELSTAVKPKAALAKMPPAPKGPPSRQEDDDSPPRVKGKSQRSEEVEEEEEEEEDRPRRSRKKKKQANKGLLLGICAAVGGVVLLGIGGLIWWRLAAKPDAGPPPVAQNPPAVGQPADVKPPPGGQPPDGNPPANPAKANSPAKGGNPTDLAKETLDKTTRATAFIKVDTGSRIATGSGFLVKVNGDTAYLITNHHVVAVSREEARPPTTTPKSKSKGPSSGPISKVGPPPGFGKSKFGSPFVTGPFGQKSAPPKVKPKITVVLNSNTPAEQSLNADLVAIDEEADLAALRIIGARNLPTPLDVGQEVAVAETQPVFIFGFPVGKAPVKPGSPEMTVGKGSISGIRRNANNELVDVHINGEINPGNSGGPVVDAQGRLIGIAVAHVPGKQIGFAVPSAELNQMFKGRIYGAFVYQVKPQQRTRLEVAGELWLFDRKSTVRQKEPIAIQFYEDTKNINIPSNQYFVFTRLSDPMQKINAATLHYALTNTVPTEGNAQGWPALANAKQVNLKIQDQDATGTFQLPPEIMPDQTCAFQFSFINAEGQTIFTQPHLLRLNFGKSPR